MNLLRFTATMTFLLLCQCRSTTPSKDLVKSPVGSDQGNLSLTCSPFKDDLPVVQVDPAALRLVGKPTFYEFAAFGLNHVAMEASSDPAAPRPDGFWYEICSEGSAPVCQDGLTSDGLAFATLTEKGLARLKARACVYPQRANAKLAAQLVKLHDGTEVYCGTAVDQVAQLSGNDPKQPQLPVVRQRNAIDAKIGNKCGLIFDQLIAKPSGDPELKKIQLAMLATGREAYCQQVRASFLDTMIAVQQTDIQKSQDHALALSAEDCSVSEPVVAVVTKAATLASSTAPADKPVAKSHATVAMFAIGSIVAATGVAGVVLAANKSKLAKTALARAPGWKNLDMLNASSVAVAGSLILVTAILVHGAAKKDEKGAGLSLIQASSEQDPLTARVNELRDLLMLRKKLDAALQNADAGPTRLK